MKQFFKNAITSTVRRVKGMGSRVKAGVLAACIAILSPVGAFAQSLANTGYDAGTNAMEEVATQIAAYVPYVVNLCYALAGVVAIVGAISVYIATTRTIRCSRGCNVPWSSWDYRGGTSPGRLLRQPSESLASCWSMR